MPDLTLFFSPRACSLACHIALEESGLPFTAKAVKIREGQHRAEEYLRVNPWGKIPAMLVEGVSTRRRFRPCGNSFRKPSTTRTTG